MRGRRLLSYRDAVAILGGDSEALAAADQALGGALSAATGGASDAVLGIFGAQGRVLRLGRDLTSGLRDRLGSSQRADRTEMIAAAHAVLVITAFFEALAEADLPFDTGDLELTRDEQLALAGADTGAADPLRVLLTAEAPLPTPFQSFEDTLGLLGDWYARPAQRLLGFTSGLSLWDRLNERQRDRTTVAMVELGSRAVVHYQELFAQLALDIPEFGFWSGQIEHRATRNEVRQSLSGVADALHGLARSGVFSHAATGLVAAHRAPLTRSILAEGDAPSGITVPSLAEGYVDPDFRVATVPEDGSGPAQEHWWDRMPVRSDLTEFLAGTLTSLASTVTPLLVLGQPGAGKSVLTKILAARLSDTGYLPVRIVLREIRGEDDIQDQIEHAVRLTTSERTSWPELVRAAPHAVPVLLFDGFDELLQATGVSQADYLLRVAKFQQREADQGRPVHALVTSRTAVADRARCPQGTVALRLEPFREPHIARWLGVWNGLNAPHFAERGLRPLSSEVASRQGELASQPLLLLMLALYDATGNALQRERADGEPLAAADLYEELLSSFAVREIGKSGDPLSVRRRDELCAQELQRLALIAFGILNRRRQWITTAELEQDLTALLRRSGTAAPTDFRTPLNQAEIALGRFFFVQRAQAFQDDRALSTYEFLHATFGEYLVARLAVQLIDQLLDHRPALSLGRAKADDDLLYALLSFALLASRQMLRFVRSRIQHLAPERRERLAELLITVMDDARHRVEHQYADYRPIRRATSSRHGKYEANLLLLTVLVKGRVTASELFPHATDPAGVWPHRAQLWRAALTEQEWTDLALALRVERGWADGRRELTIRPATEATEPDLVDPVDPVDPYWVYRYPPGHEFQTSHRTWSSTDWEALRHKMDVGGGGQELLLGHALDPLFSRFGFSIAAFHGAEGRATSWAHDVLELWLVSHLDEPKEELIARYERCAKLLVRAEATGAGTEHHDEVVRLILRQLLNDAHVLPVALVFRMVTAARIESVETAVLTARIMLRRLATLDGYPQDEAGGLWRGRLLGVLRQVLELVVSAAPARLPEVWETGTSSRVAARQLLTEYEARVTGEPAERLRELRRRYDEH